MSIIKYKTLQLVVLIILTLGYIIFSITGCIQEYFGGNREMPFRDLEISDGENELFYSGIINVKIYGAVGNGSTDDTAAINSAISAASNKNLLISPGTYRIASSVTVPSNVKIWFSNGAKISVDSGKTLTINGQLVAERYQIFTGDGTVNISQGACDEVYPEWWGAVGNGTTNDTTALQKCIDCASTLGNVKVVKLGEKTYKITSAITTGGNGINIIGSSMNRSWILASGGCDGIRVTPYATGSTREQLLFKNFRIYSDSVVTGYGIYISGHRDFTIDHVWVGGYYDNYKGFEYGIYALNQPTYYLRIVNCRIFYCKYGIYITGTANNAVIEHNTIRYGARLVTLDLTSGTRIINNSIETDTSATNGGNPPTERLITLTGNARDTVIANNYLEHSSNQAIELQSGCKRARIFGNTKGVWLYDRSDVLDNSGNDTNSYDDKVVFKYNIEDVYGDQIYGIIDTGRQHYHDLSSSSPYHASDMKIRAISGHLQLQTDRNNRYVDIKSHIEADTLNTPYGGFGKRYGNLINYSEAINAGWSKYGSTTVTDNCVVSPEGLPNASRIYGLQVSKSISGSFVDGDVINVSVWLRCPDGEYQTCTILVTDGSARIGILVCRVTNQWRRFIVPCVYWRGLGSYSTLGIGVYLEGYGSSINRTLEMWGAQAVRYSGVSVTGTDNSSIDNKATWLMDTTKDFASVGINRGGWLVVRPPAGGTIYGGYIDEVQSYISYTNGSGTAPSVGSQVTGNTSGATATIANYVLSSGSWSNGDATGYIRVRYVNGAFSNSETISFTSATATCSNYYANSVLTLTSPATVYGSKSDIDNGDTYFVYAKQYVSPPPYTATYGTAITGSNADFYAENIATSGLKANLADNLTLGDYNIHISSNPSADKWSGITTTFTAGENLALGDVCYMNSNGKMVKADADAISTAGVIAMATGTINNNASGTFLLQGVIHLHTLNPSWTVGSKVYLSTTAGAMTQTQPNGADDVIQILGTAIAGDILLFNPNLVMVEHN